MSFAETLLPEFDREMETTRRVLARVPDGRGEWSPHPRSFPLGHLAQLVATMPGWIPAILREPSMDLAGGPTYSFEATATLLEGFDRAVSAARDAIAASDDARLAEPWSLTHGERVLLTSPRATVVRDTVNHIIHHRGQLSVYLRLLDVPVPSIYGPSADEGWSG